MEDVDIIILCSHASNDPGQVCQQAALCFDSVQLPGLNCVLAARENRKLAKCIIQASICERRNLYVGLNVLLESDSCGMALLMPRTTCHDIPRNIYIVMNP